MRDRITFIGPDSGILAQMGDKLAAKATALACGVPTIPGSKEQMCIRDSAGGAWDPRDVQLPAVDGGIVYLLLGDVLEHLGGAVLAVLHLEELGGLVNELCVAGPGPELSLIHISSSVTISLTRARISASDLDQAFGGAALKAALPGLYFRAAVSSRYRSLMTSDR